MQPKPVSLSRRLYCRTKAWYLRRLDKSLNKQLKKVETKLLKAAAQAQANALLHRCDPALQEKRRFLRADHQVIRDRQLIVSRELRDLGGGSVSRAIDLTLKPSDSSNGGAQLGVYTYAPASVRYSEMAEAVYLDLSVARSNFMAELTPDEARVFANQLLQVADTADEHRAARLADAERQASFDEISEELREAEERGGGAGVYYAHPDVHYVPADQVHAKAQELHAAGVKRFMVLAEPLTEAAA